METTAHLDLAPACTALAGVVAGVRDDQLGGPTPCPDYAVGDLLDHVAGLCLAFVAAARKQAPPGGGAASGDASGLPADWRAVIGDRLEALAAAWADPSAHEGDTVAGPVPMPAPVAALVALDEVLVHGWDLAVATGQPYHPDGASVAACLDFARSFEPPEGVDGPFGPPVAVPEDAPLLDRLVGATGRDPAWRAGRFPAS